MARSIKNVKNVINKYDTIIFDFDGTLINSEPAHNLGHKIMLETLLGYEIPDFESFVDSYIGKKDSIIFEEFKEIFHLTCDTSTMFDLKRKAVLDILLNNPHSMNKYIEDMFAAKGNKSYYILSNNHKSFVDEVLEKKGYSKYIDAIFCMEDMSLTKDVFLDNVSSYIKGGVDKDTLLICEDSVPFIKYLVENGYNVLSVEHRYNKGQVSNAKYIIKDGFIGE